jgi:hypothetical protein
MRALREEPARVCVRCALVSLLAVGLLSACEQTEQVDGPLHPQDGAADASVWTADAQPPATRSNEAARDASLISVQDARALDAASPTIVRETGTASAQIADASVTMSADGAPSASAPCSSDSTFEAIQKSIFEGKGCTASACHGSARAGDLDLTHTHAYGALINKPAGASLTTPMNLVTPGEQALSFLYRKLAAATDPESKLPAGGGSPMPSGSAPLTHEQLEAVRLWIRSGAPERGVVAGTHALLDCAQPSEATPNKSARPPIPAPELGFQHASGPWSVKSNAENEVCFATYYDLSSSAPADARVRCTIGGREQECVAYNRRELSQDAQSHHSIISVYAGSVAPTHAVWGKWQCAGGALAGTPCDPTKAGVSAVQGGADCGESAVCQAPPKQGTCASFGPTDKETTNSTVPAGGSQAPVSADRYPAGVYSELPIRGVVLWNSHGFNLTTKAASIEQYNSFWYARPEQRSFRMDGIFTAGKHAIYEVVDGVPQSRIRVAPFTTQELCETYTLPRYARLSELSAHAHKRAVQWRTWLPPNIVTCSGDCAPRSDVPAYRSVSYNDPVVLRFDPPRVFDQADEAARTLLFCATYDNGKLDPKLLKRKSRLIEGSDCVSAFNGLERLSCVAGDKQGTACTSDAQCGSGGACDACDVEWGERTEDEMFFLLGQFYVQPPTP